MKSIHTGSKETIRFRTPEPRDAKSIHTLIDRCKPLDLNSVYAYLLLTHHFRDTCLLAEDDEVIGVTTSFIPPNQQDTLFIWQVAVAPEWRSKKVALRMLEEILSRCPNKIGFVESTVTPSNKPSQKLFEMLADVLDSELQVQELFSDSCFGTGHESENLIRIGPIRRTKGKE